MGIGYIHRDIQCNGRRFGAGIERAGRGWGYVYPVARSPGDLIRFIGAVLGVWWRFSLSGDMMS